MLTIRICLSLVVISTLALSACKHVPRGDTALPERHAYLPHEQPALPSQVVLPNGDEVQMPDTCAERFLLVQKALWQDMKASPAPWIVAVLEHDSMGGSEQNAVAASDKNAVAASDKNAVAASDKNAEAASDKNAVAASDKNAVAASDKESRATVDTDSAPVDKDPATQIGYAPAQDLLARITLEGDGVPKNSAKAFSLALDAARQDYTKAQILVASLYIMGRGIARDDEQAFNWLREAARMDGPDMAPEENSSAKNSSAKNSTSKNSPAQKSSALNSPNETMADQHDRAEAMLMLADAYRQGRGVAKDDEEAFLWTYKSAQAGNTRAFWWLGLHYYYGLGTPRDVSFARDLLEPFADAGDKEALSLLEEME